MPGPGSIPLGPPLPPLILTAVKAVTKRQAAVALILVGLVLGYAGLSGGIYYNGAKLLSLTANSASIQAIDSNGNVLASPAYSLFDSAGNPVQVLLLLKYNGPTGTCSGGTTDQYVCHPNLYSIQGYVDGVMGRGGGFPGDGGLIMNLGPAATWTTGSHNVYVVLTFIDGSTITSNDLAFSISGSLTPTTPAWKVAPAQTPTPAPVYVKQPAAVSQCQTTSCTPLIVPSPPSNATYISTSSSDPTPATGLQLGSSASPPTGIDYGLLLLGIAAVLGGLYLRKAPKAAKTA